MTTTLTGSSTLVVVDCCVCGVTYAIPKVVEEYLRAHPRAADTHCPNGHTWHYLGETDAQKLQRQVNQERDRAAAERARADRAEASLRTTRGHVTRLRKRAHAGVCPFGCHRHFADLERHVASKHPGQQLDGES